MPSPDIPDYTFGVELEVLMPRTRNGPAGRTALAQALTAAGFPAAAENWNHELRTHWKLTTDGTIGYENTEIVSPILQGTAGLEAVLGVCRTIDEFGCSVRGPMGRACGLHVHVGVRQFARRVGVFKELLRTYNRYEGVIDQLIAPSRRGIRNRWCAPPIWNPQVESARNLDELRALCGGKYRKIGVDSYWRHGTVEFRHHQGTVNGEKTVNWIKLCLRMIEHSAKNNELSRERGGVYVPGPRPSLPLVPTFDDPIDYAACPRIGGDAIPRFTTANRYRLQHLVIVHVSHVDQTTRRNRESAGYAHYVRHNHRVRNELIDGSTGVSLNIYSRRGGLRTHLAWDVDHGYVRVVDVAGAPPRREPSEAERQRRAEELARVHAERERLTNEYEATERARRAEWEQANRAEGEPVPLVRPATETTPVTLEGLFDLLELAPSERTYFEERHLELNP